MLFISNPAFNMRINAVTGFDGRTMKHLLDDKHTTKGVAPKVDTADMMFELVSTGTVDVVGLIGHNLYPHTVITVMLYAEATDSAGNGLGFPLNTPAKVQTRYAGQYGDSYFLEYPYSPTYVPENEIVLDKNSKQFHFDDFRIYAPILVLFDSVPNIRYVYIKISEFSKDKTQAGKTLMYSPNIRPMNMDSIQLGKVHISDGIWFKDTNVGQNYQLKYEPLNESDTFLYNGARVLNKAVVKHISLNIQDIDESMKQRITDLYATVGNHTPIVMQLMVPGLPMHDHNIYGRIESNINFSIETYRSYKTSIQLKEYGFTSVPKLRRSLSTMEESTTAVDYIVPDVGYSLYYFSTSIVTLPSNAAGNKYTIYVHRVGDLYVPGSVRIYYNLVDTLINFNVGEHVSSTQINIPLWAVGTSMDVIIKYDADANRNKLTIYVDEGREDLSIDNPSMLTTGSTRI